jgi:environmental stress-induced protein Ves
MSWHTTHLADVPCSPWRNGGGVTRELACWPDPEHWVWRMSVAEVTQSGPFSRYEGVQRWFAVVAGTGVRLVVGSETHAVTADGGPLCFDGAAAVHCELLDGPTQDFNLMLRGDPAAAQMTRLGGEYQVTLSATKLIAIYAIDTRARVQFDHEYFELAAHSLAWRQFDAGTTVQVTAPNALWMEIDA